MSAMLAGLEDEAPLDLSGRILIAMPDIGDPRFERTIIYMCVHSSEGAMGLIINRAAEHVSFGELLEQLEIDAPLRSTLPIVSGGPVEASRGFVLHTADYAANRSTMLVSESIAMTGTVDILRAIAEGSGPERALLALGYAGWGAGQIEAEIAGNGWLHCEADDGLIFSTEFESKWARALGKLGVAPAALSSTAGRA